MNVKHFKLLNLIAALAMLLGLIPVSVVAAPIIAITGNSPELDVSGEVTFVGNHDPVVVAPSLVITPGAESTLSSATRVFIGDNFAATDDRLGIEGQSGTSGTAGVIAWTYNTTTGVMSLDGTDTITNYQAALRTVTYYNLTNPTVATTRTVDFSLGAALPFDGNGHFYEYVSSSGIRWDNAQTAAAARSYFGQQGYLATITSAGENGFAADKLVGQGWIGASDMAVEGEWRWVTGPESGTQFWQGDENGNPVGGAYANWFTGEPNDAGGEHYAHFKSDGTWNDYPIDASAIDGYVVEYGGTPGDPVLNITGQVLVHVVRDYTLTINLAGTGTGAVTTEADGTLVLPGDRSFAPGTVVTLTATASLTSTFAGWSGAAMGTNSVTTVTMDANKVVTATFNANADLAVTEDVLRSSKAITYTIVVQNDGPNAAGGAVVSSTFSSEVSDITWTCVGSGGATCGSGGTLNLLLNDTLTAFPAGGVVTYTVQGTLGLLATGNNVVTVTPPSNVTDPDLSNNRAEYITYRCLLPLVFRNAAP